MRIAYVTDQLLPRTATDSHQTMAMVSAMGEAGADVTLVTPRRHDRTPPTQKEIAAYYDVLPNFDLAAVRSLYPSVRGLEKIAHAAVALRRQTIREHDLVYTRAIPVLVSALLAGIPCAYETYRPWPDQRRRLRPLFRWVGRHERFRGAILHSQMAMESYARIGVPREWLLTAYNGHDPRLLQPVLSPREARVACGLPEAPTVVYSGSVVERKGLGLLLDIAGRMPDVTFVFVGSERDGWIERRAAASPNIRVVRWMPLAETVRYLYAADVLVIPPTSKPLEDVGNTVLPIKTFLYLAAGRAILAPETGDLREVLSDGVNAALVTPDKPQVAFDRLQGLLANPDERMRLGDQARIDAKQYTWSARARKVLDFISSTAELTA